jgi:hypothetical protein
MLVVSVNKYLGMWNLQDRNLLSGNIAMFLGEFNLAQDLFLASGKPLAALEVILKFYEHVLYVQSYC